jgi:hypothetical protein
MLAARSVLCGFPFRRKNMNEYLHHVSGFFPHREEANSALSRLVELGLPRERLRLFADDPAASDILPKEGSDAVLKDVLVDATIGTAVGAGVGALGTVALAAASVSLFVASPLVAPLVMLGWGASIGGLIGAATGATPGAGNKDGWLSDLIGDAIASGQVVLVAETRTEQETAIAREVIQASVGDSKSANMV